MNSYFLLPQKSLFLRDNPTMKLFYNGTCLKDIAKLSDILSIVSLKVSGFNFFRAMATPVLNKRKADTSDFVRQWNSVKAAIRSAEFSRPII